MPTESLRAIAKHEIEYKQLSHKPVIVGQLGLMLQLSGMNNKLFRMEVLLPMLDTIDGNLAVKRCLVVGATAIDNCTEFERDNKAIREIWRKCSKKYWL